MSAIIQRSEEWYAARLGCVTGSRFHDVIAVGRDGKPLAARETVITEIVLELITGKPGAMWSSKATRWGIEHEAEAREAYEIATGNMCTEVGFITHPLSQQIGCSPDHLIRTDGGGEIKCPLTPTVHLWTLLNGMPPEHVAQCQGGMYCTGRQFWDFVSYHPAFPPEMQIYVQRIERDDAYIRMLEDKLPNAVAEINLTVKQLIEKYGVTQ